MKAWPACRTSRAPCGTEVEIPALAEVLGGSREAQNGPDLIAKENDRNGQKDDHRAQHPEHENMGVRLVSESAAGHQAKHSAAEIDAYFHQPRSTDGIEPERLRDLLSNFVGKDSRQWIQRPIKGSGHDWRQRAGRQQGRVHAKPFRRQIGQKGIVLAGRELLIKVGQRSDVARHRLGKPAGHQIPMMLHECERHRGLQKHHRHDHDQERALVEPLRQQLGEAARRAAPEEADLRQPRQTAECGSVPHRSAMSRYPAPRAVCR